MLCFLPEFPQKATYFKTPNIKRSKSTVEIASVATFTKKHLRVIIGPITA